jgi:Ca2+-binding RTX toxin-like protein
VVVNLALGAASGGDGNDTLSSIENIRGSQFDDTLTGDANANILDGNGGADRMEGGTGSDTYYVDNTGDQVIEAESQVVLRAASGGDIDRVIASINYVLGSYLENLTLAGAATAGTGNALDNILAGNTENNALTGLAGNDSLDGGAGIDTAVFSGNRADYTITRTRAGFTVSGSADGTDTLTGIEHLQFADQTLDVTPLSDYGARLQVFATAWLERPLSPAELIQYTANYAAVAASGGNIYATELHAFFLANDAGNFLDSTDYGEVITDMYERLTGTRDVPEEMYDTFIDRLGVFWSADKLAVKMIKGAGFWGNTDGSFGKPPAFPFDFTTGAADELPALQADLDTVASFVIPDSVDDALVLVGVTG